MNETHSDISYYHVKNFATTYHPSKTMSTVSHMHSNDEGFLYALTVLTVYDC